MTTKQRCPPAHNQEGSNDQAAARSRDILVEPADIARGPSGDCCILCGKVAENLPLDHGCKPNIDVQAYRAQLSNALDSSERGAA